MTPGGLALRQDQTEFVKTNCELASMSRARAKQEGAQCKASKRTILSTFGAEASACRDALDLAEYTRAMLCEVEIGGKSVTGGALAHSGDYGLLELVRLLGQASVPEDRGTALTVASLRERCSAGVGRDQKRSGLMWEPTRVQLADGLTKSCAGIFLRSAMISGYAQLTRKVEKS